MSQYAKMAVLTAAAQDASILEALKGANMELAVSQILELTAEEKAEIVAELSSTPTSQPQPEDVGSRENPGPGITGR